MLRLPAVAGRFYPSNPSELRSAVQSFTNEESGQSKPRAKACLVPHAGYVYSGAVAGAVFARIELPKTVVILGVRHAPRGAPVAILSSGQWRTPLGDAEIDEPLAAAIKTDCRLWKEDSLAHANEHSLEVQLPFLQVLAPNFRFVPLALGTVRFEELVAVGESLARVLFAQRDGVLLLTTSDLNHYEDDATTRRKDGMALERLLALDPAGLYETCRRESISMCGLGPAVALLTAMRCIGAASAELVKYATSADVSGDRDMVVGYAGITFD